MFTGIIEEIGKIRTINTKNIEIECVKILKDAALGDSIAVNGVCLTITNITKDSFTADTSPETLKVTTFGDLKSGSFVNLERAMRADGRFGGHMVSGHIDGVAKVFSNRKNSDFYDLEIELSDEQAKYVIKKGSITVNGTSLTIADINGNTIKIAIIPHTYENTTLAYLKASDYVNIEVDILAKYVEKILSTRDNSSRISMDFLQRNGFC